MCVTTHATWLFHMCHDSCISDIWTHIHTHTQHTRTHTHNTHAHTHTHTHVILPVARGAFAAAAWGLALAAAKTCLWTNRVVHPWHQSFHTRHDSGEGGFLGWCKGLSRPTPHHFQERHGRGTRLGEGYVGAYGGTRRSGLKRDTHGCVVKKEKGHTRTTCKVTRGLKFRDENRFFPWPGQRGAQLTCTCS